MPSRWAGNRAEQPEGIFFVKNVYESWPELPDIEIKRLRIVQVLLKTTPNANQPKVGAPNVEGGKVTATVQSHGRAKKVEIIKFRRRKHHDKRIGHRQHYTELLITGIQG